MIKSRIFCILFLVVVLTEARCSNSQKQGNKPDISTLSQSEGDTLVNRLPAVAGSFYPRNKEELSLLLTKLFSGAVKRNNAKQINAIISPHAGYVYSGMVAASAFNQLSEQKHYDNVFIIGSSHVSSFDGGAFYSEGNFITPLGVARVNLPLVRKLIAENPSLFISNSQIHAPEHSIEVQIPFLQHTYKNGLQIVPLIIGTQRPAVCKKIAEALRPYFNGNNLFVISTDFSHYTDYQNACKVDASTAEAIVKNSPAEFLRTIETNENQQIPGLVTSICGWSSVLTLLHITENNPDYMYNRIIYMNSGDARGESRDKVVGYHAITITYEPSLIDENTNDKLAYTLTSGEQKQLLRLARNTIKNYLVNGQMLKVDAGKFSDKILARSGAFVTLNKNGQLRGCIGQFFSDIPLYQVVQEMAISSAIHDNRFDPLTIGELDQVEIEISVLTPMHKITSIDEIELGRHGIYIKKGNRAGTFLPQVATQTGWNLQEFLGHCSQDKAGIGWEGWKNAEVFVYEAYVFGE